MNTMKCKSCGGVTELSKDKKQIYCPYCGASELIEESDAVKIQQIKSQTEKELELTRLKTEQEKEKKQENKEKLKSFKKGLLSKLLIIFTIISALFCAMELSSGISITGIIALVQAILYISAWLMGMQVIKNKGRTHILLTVISLLLIIPFLMTFGYSPNEKKEEEFLWTDLNFHEIIPETKSNIGEITSNNESYLHIYVHNTSNEEYIQYVNDCKDMSFNIESEASDTNYTAYNENGYEIKLWYNENNSILSISVNEPRKMSEIKWPTIGPATLLPIPNSLYGSISYDNSNNFIAYIGNISIEEFSEYTENCINHGFSIDYKRTDKNFSATNNEGYILKINYVGFNTIEISIKTPEIETNDTIDSNENNIDEDEPKNDNENLFDAFGVTPEFKEAMDSYEKFFDEYIAFMEKYKNSNYSLDLLNDYNAYMEQYTETMDEFEDIKNQNLSLIDQAYYLKVHTAVTKKLLNVSLNS